MANCGGRAKSLRLICLQPHTLITTFGFTVRFREHAFPLRYEVVTNFWSDLSAACWTAPTKIVRSDVDLHHMMRVREARESDQAHLGCMSFRLHILSE